MGVANVDHAGMKNEPDRHWTQWLLAAWEGIVFGWFLCISHVAARNLIQISEFVWHPRPESTPPRLTLWLLNVLPEETWALLIGLLAFILGFGLVSLASNEAPASRLFRWSAIAVLTMLVGLSLPAMAAFKNLSGGPDGQSWDEVLFVALALSVLMYGIIRCRRLSHPQA